SVARRARGQGPDVPGQVGCLGLGRRDAARHSGTPGQTLFGNRCERARLDRPAAGLAGASNGFLGPYPAGLRASRVTAFPAGGGVEEVIRHYTAAVALRPQSVSVHHNLGMALLARDRPDEAIACFHRALELDRGFAMTHSSLGAALAAQGKQDEAISCYRKAI